MTADPRRRAFRNVQRRVRRRQSMTGEPYASAAAAVEAEWNRGRLYLSDPSVPADVAAAVREAGLIPLEPLNSTPHWDWWCRCRWCGEVLTVRRHDSLPHRPPFVDGEHQHASGRCTRQRPARTTVTEWSLRQEGDTVMLVIPEESPLRGGVSSSQMLTRLERLHSAAVRFLGAAGSEKAG